MAVALREFGRKLTSNDSQPNERNGKAPNAYRAPRNEFADAFIEVRRAFARGAGFGEGVTNGTTVLNGVSFDVFPGDVFTILGGSGCGKSTLLNILIGVEEPTAGTVHILDENIHRLPKRKRKELMREVGVLFQSGALLQSLTVAQNVALPFQQHHPEISRDRELLEETVLMKLRAVRLAAHAAKYPRELSGGMKKRAALARALALDPKLLISDEPTSGLDPVSTKEIDNLTITLSRKSGATVIVVTHDLLSFQRIATRGIMLGAERDGKLRGTVLISGSRDEFFASKHPLVRSFLHPEDDGVLVAAGEVISNCGRNRYTCRDHEILQIPTWPLRAGAGATLRRRSRVASLRVVSRAGRWTR